MTPTTGMSRRSRRWSSAAAAALLHATTIIRTSCSSSRSTISSEYFRTSSAGFGPYGKAAGVAEVDDVGAGNEVEQRPHDREAAETAVEHADRPVVAHHRRRTLLAGRGPSEPIARRRRRCRRSSAGSDRQDHVDTARGRARAAARRGRGRTRRRRRARRAPRPRRRRPAAARTRAPSSAARDELDAGIRRVVRRQAFPAPRPRRRCGAASGAPTISASRSSPTPPTRSTTRLVAGDVDDRRLDADRARTAVEHEVDVGAEVVAHVLRGRRAHAAEPVRRRRRDAAAERVEQRERDRMVGDTDADRVAPARRLGRDRGRRCGARRA